MLQAAPSTSSSSTASTTTPAFPDIRAFLRPVGVMETRYVRALSSLCALTYHLDKLTVGAGGAGSCPCLLALALAVGRAASG